MMIMNAKPMRLGKRTRRSIDSSIMRLSFHERRSAVAPSNEFLSLSDSGLAISPCDFALQFRIARPPFEFGFFRSELLVLGNRTDVEHHDYERSFACPLRRVMHSSCRRRCASTRFSAQPLQRKASFFEPRVFSPFLKGFGFPSPRVL